MITWEILTTDNSHNPDPKVARFVIRAIKKGEPVVFYGTGDTWLQAKHDLDKKITAHEEQQKKEQV
jgi:hypothetical protein